MLDGSKMRIIDKIVDYFFNRKIKVKNIDVINEVGDAYYNAAIYSKIPFMKKYCIWSTFTKNIEDAKNKIDIAYKNKTIVKDDMTFVEYIDRIWYKLKDCWLNVIDITNEDNDIIKKTNGVFKKPLKKWFWGFGIQKRVFRPFSDNYIHPILYINKSSVNWKPKYDYVCFENNPQMWICLFKFFWFGYIIVSPVKEDFEDSYWEQMIWYVNYCDCDLKKAEETWYGEWNKEYLIK